MPPVASAGALQPHPYHQCWLLWVLPQTQEAPVTHSTRPDWACKPEVEHPCSIIPVWSVLQVSHTALPPPPPEHCCNCLFWYMARTLLSTFFLFLLSHQINELPRNTHPVKNFSNNRQYLQAQLNHGPSSCPTPLAAPGNQKAWVQVLSPLPSNPNKSSTM